jgi:glycosyltransferase involved in cell wall biosynthesis
VLGWSLLEAMACGCCVVGSTGMPVQEVIRNGVEGVLVPMTDPQLLAQAVLGCLADGRRREQFGRAARQASLAWDQTVTLPQLAALVANPLG